MNGKPLFYYILNTLLQSNYINQIIIDIDNNIIEEKIKQYFDNDIIKFYYRREKLQGNNMSTNKLLLQLVKDLKLNPDLYIYTHVTNPLLNKETIDKAIFKYIHQNQYDSLFTVNELYTRFYYKNGQPINHDLENLIPTQDLEPYYEENSCLYIIPHQILLKYKRRIGNNPLLYPISKLEAQDIDWEDDFKLTEFIMKSQSYKSNKKVNKTILITGACGGIGEGISKKFKLKGWYVIGIDIFDKNSNKYLDQYIKCDLSDPQQIDNINIDRLDVLVNNAAIQINKKLIDTEIEDWNKTLSVNLTAAYLLSKKFYYLLKELEGHIINISSVHATHTSENICAYATSKGGLTALTRSMALEFGKDGINVNCILPGAIDTPMLRDGLQRDHTYGDNVDKRIDNLSKKHVMGKIGKSQDVAEVVYFLSTKTRYMIGQSIVIDGGAIIRLSTE